MKLNTKSQACEEYLFLNTTEGATDVDKLFLLKLLQKLNITPQDYDQNRLSESEQAIDVFPLENIALPSYFTKTKKFKEDKITVNIIRNSVTVSVTKEDENGRFSLHWDLVKQFPSADDLKLCDWKIKLPKLQYSLTDFTLKRDLEEEEKTENAKSSKRMTYFEKAAGRAKRFLERKIPDEWLAQNQGKLEDARRQAASECSTIDLTRKTRMRKYPCLQVVPKSRPSDYRGWDHVDNTIAQSTWVKLKKNRGRKVGDKSKKKSASKKHGQSDDIEMEDTESL